MEHTTSNLGAQSLLETACQTWNETFTNFKMQHGALVRTCPFTVGHICTSVGIIYVLYIIIYKVYNIFFHPLASFPGPLLARASLLWRFWHTMSVRSHRIIEKQHNIYGSVFRVSPNELSFASASSWKAIYGTPAAGKEQFIKSEFYDMYGSGFKTGCIGNERDPKKHAQKKRDLSAVFSTRSLSQQEEIMQRCVDGFITKIADCSSKSSDGIDIVKWCEMVSFDIMGEMAFGESFHCIEKGKHHPWMDLILDHLLIVPTVSHRLKSLLMSSLGTM